jgi:hypothetical protein
MRSHGKHLVGRASFETRAGAHCRTQPRTSPVVSNAEAFVVSGCSCLRGRAGRSTQLTFNVRGSNARRAVRAYGSAGWTALGLTLVSRRKSSYSTTARHVARICSQTHIKGVNPCREHRPDEHRPDEHRPAPPARPAPPTRARPGRPRGATRTGPRGRGGRGARQGPAAVSPGRDARPSARASRNARKNIDEDPSTAHVCRAA